MPLLSTVKPLIAVVVHLGTKSYARWESAIAEGGKGASAWDFVNVSNDKNVALIWGLETSEGKNDLFEEGVTSEAFARPSIIFGEIDSRNVEDTVDNFVLERLETEEVVL